MRAHNCRKDLKTNLQRYLHIGLAWGKGQESKKHQEVLVVKATRNQRENYLKGMLNQLLYARGDAQRTDDKNKNKKKTRIKR